MCVEVTLDGKTASTSGELAELIGSEVFWLWGLGDPTGKYCLCNADLPKTFDQAGYEVVSDGEEYSDPFEVVIRKKGADDAK